LGELAEILNDVNVEMIPLRYHWGCRTFQTASHIYVIHILGVLTPQTVVDEHMAAHSHLYHHRGFPRFGRVYWNSRWCQCGNDPNTLSLRLSNLSNCIPHLCHTYRLGVAHFSMLKALKVLIFSYSLFCVLILIPP
jgi:hypothetical protein